MNDEIIEEFMIEAAEMFESAEEGFLNLERGEDFNSNFNLIFRAFHSLKGAAGMFGLQDLQGHMHKLESLFEAQKSKGLMDKKQVDYFLAGIDAAKALLEGKPVHFVHQDSLENLSEAIIKETKAVAHAVEEKLEQKKFNNGKTRGLVFIVDDEEDILDILDAYLSSIHFQVQTFQRAEDALAALKEHAPDMVLTDLTMPKMDGIKLAKEIRLINSNVPIIMVSGNLSKEKVLELLCYDIFGFIEKPFNESAIVEICERAFDLSQLNNLLSKSINYILYQFSDLDSYLKSVGKENIRLSLKEELKTIIRIQNELAEKKKRKLSDY
jgi:FixJ family two-component response regulator